MQVSRRRIFGCAAAALIPIHAVAAAGAQLRLVVPALPGILDPQRALTSFDRAVCGELFRGLVARDGTGALVPGLAESWTQSPEGLTYTFTLRSDAKWSDGTAITAQDALFALTRARDPATAAPFVGLLAPIAPLPQSVTAIDRRTLRITLHSRNTHFLEVMAEPVAAPLPRAHMARVGEAWAEAGQIVCSGTFRPAVTASGFDLVRHPAASNRTGPDLIRFEVAATTEAAVERVRQGAADLAWGFFSEPMIDQAAQPFLQADPAEALLFVAVNTRRPKLSNRELRHSLGMSIDRAGLARALDVTASYAPTPPSALNGGTAHPATYERIKADDRAIIAQVLLLEEDVDPAHPLTVRLIYPAGRAAATIAKSLAVSWRPLGFQIDLQEQSTALYAQSLVTGDYDLALATSPVCGDTPWPYLAWLASTAGGDNLPRYAEADFDRLLSEAASLNDPGLVQMSLNEAEAMVSEDQIILPIMTFHPLHAVGARVRGWTANQRCIHPLHLLDIV